MNNKNPYMWFSGDEDLDRFKECFDENNSPKTLEHLRWQYLNNFHKISPLVALGLSDTINNKAKFSGIYATFPVEFYLNGNIVYGVQSLDTLTSSDFRGRGVFNDLATAVYEKCISENINLIYGFPNGNSAHGFFKKLEWTRLDPVPFLIKPIKLNYFLSKIPVMRRISNIIPLTAFSFKKINFKSLKYNVAIGDDYDNLWDEFKKRINIGINRSASFMKWRLEDKPGFTYENIASYDESGNMVAICFFSIQKKHGGNIAYIMDMIFLPGFEKSAENVLAAVNKKITQYNCDAILAWCFEHSFNYKIYKNSGYFDFPEKFRPIELHFGARSFILKNKEVIDKRASWYISYIDSDTV